MPQPIVKIFSYLPNPRVWKSLIAAQLCGVEVEVVGDKPAKLAGWLWDYDARELAAEERNADHPHARTGRRGFSGTLYKTDAFLEAHPFGTVPAAFVSGGEIGVFESNSILRAVVRSAADARGLYGRSGGEASRVDSFLDANLVFAREAQVYLLGLDALTAGEYERMAQAYEFYLSGIENTLAQDEYLVGGCLTIADISFVCDVLQFSTERRRRDQLAAQGYQPVSLELESEYPRAREHLLRLSRQPAFEPYVGRLAAALSDA